MSKVQSAGNTLSSIQLAISHVTEMMKTHHPVKVEKMVLMLAPSFDQGRPLTLRNDRSVSIIWAPGPTPKYVPQDVLVTLGNYEDEGYRAVDVVTGDLTSVIRLVKGDLSVEEEYRMILETRSLISFDYNADSNLIKMWFEEGRIESNMNDFERRQLPFLHSIKKSTTHWGPKKAFIVIESFYEKPIPDKEIKFTIKDSPRVKSMDEIAKMLSKSIGRLNMARYTPDNWPEETKQFLDSLALPPNPDTGIKMEGYPGEYEAPKGCPDCTDGFYTPLIGPREPCQTCKPKEESNLDTFVQEVTNLFVRQVKAHLPSIKTHKPLTSPWSTLTIDFRPEKSAPKELIALNAGAEAASQIKSRYGEQSIVFEDYCSCNWPLREDGYIYKRATHSGVSALVSMQKSDNSYEFQVRVST